MGWNGRHDALALKRQRGLAAVLLIANLIIGIACVAIIEWEGWSPGITSIEGTICTAVFGVSWLSLLVAAGLVEWLPQITSDLLRDAGDNSRATKRMATFIARWRMAPYYLGVWANLVGVALLAEFTGGLTGSPFVALLVALVLIGQQVSRFKLQAGALLLSGAIIVIAMLACESLATPPPEPSPQLLSAALVLFAFVAGGLLNYYEKAHNYLIGKRVRPPRQVRIYRDGRNVWRFVLHRQDPVLLGSDHSPIEGGVPIELREQFERYAQQMGTHADWGELTPSWPDTCEDSFIVPLRKRGGPS